MDATIIIPTFNRWDALEETLAALARADYPANRWEVIVVDDGSTDDTEASIGRWIEQAAIQVRYVRQTNSGPAAARNRGALEARGDALIFIDNDILVKPDFVRAHVDALAAHPGCWVMGRVVHPPELRRTAFGRYRDSVWEAFHEAHTDERVSETSGMTAANVSMPAADFHRLGGFDEDFTIASCEDCDLGIRARQAGIRVVYDPRIIVLHNDWAVSLDRFCERQRLYSISDALLWRKYGSASPRVHLVQENAPVDLKADRSSLIVKKSLKRILATRPGTTLTRLACTVAERIAPDTKLSRRAYDTAVGVAIFQGVREGLHRYRVNGNTAQGSVESERERPTQSRSSGRLVCHLIDANLDTSYFRSIARNHDGERFPVMIGSIVPVGPLQKAMGESRTPTFSLGAANRWKYPFAILRLARLLRSESVAVLHAHCFDATFVGLIAARLARVPFVFTRHHSDHNVRLGKRWHTRIDAWCARHADQVIAVSEATRRVMTSIERVPEDQITVIYNGMEPLREPVAEDVERVRRELCLSKKNVCLMLARLHEEKGHRFLLDAIPEIQARVGHAVFLFAGDGPDRAALQAEVQVRGLGETVRFLGRRDDVPELISLSSVVVLPSLAESFGFVVLEAMSLGTPVVAAATGGIPELVTDGESGLLVPPADSRSLADAISRVIESPQLARSLTERGKDCVATFSLERMIRGYESVYAAILAARRPEPAGSQASAESARSRTIAG
jgi:glycosyltransferase involved in cell wall biosynthesis/GT2 family glycosyltransferase